MSPASGIYLLVPNESNERVLHLGRIVQSGGEELIVEFDRHVSPPPGTDVNLFFEVSGKFMQQGASIIAIREPEPEPAPPATSETPSADATTPKRATDLN